MYFGPKKHLLSNTLLAAALLLTVFVFLRALGRVRRSLALIPEEDREAMGRLQAEVYGKENAALTADKVLQLLQIWFVILGGAQLIYDLSSELYRKFVLGLGTALSGSELAGTTYVFLYNLTHGFKYQGMLIALLLGVMMTGIFLNDRLLRISALIVAALFMAAAAGMSMTTVSVIGQEIGFVWSSVIFHLLETVGLSAMALYLRQRYHGV